MSTKIRYALTSPEVLAGIIPALTVWTATAASILNYS